MRFAGVWFELGAAAVSSGFVSAGAAAGMGIL